MKIKQSATLSLAVAATPLLMLPGFATAANVANPLCPIETVFFAPGHGQDINVPPGFTVSLFASGLNAPTGIAFLGNKNNFNVYVLESGHGLPSRCNDETVFPGSAATNPFTPDILVFDKGGNKIAGPLGKPTDPTSTTGGTNVFQPHGPAVDIAHLPRFSRAGARGVRHWQTLLVRSDKPHVIRVE